MILWSLYDPDKLSDEAKAIITDPDNWICYSTVSLWEIEIKRLKRPDAFGFTALDMDSDCRLAGFTSVSLNPNHIFALSGIGENSTDRISHTDPFDRMLMAQAKSDGMVFLTHDSRLADYHEPNVKTV